MSETQASKSECDTTEIAELTENTYIRHLLNNKVIKYFSTDPASKITLATALITIGSFIVRLFEYMRCKGYLSVFSINIGYAQFSVSQGFSEFLFQAIVFGGFVAATSLLYLVIESLWFAHSLRKMLYSVQKTKLRSRIRLFLNDTIQRVPLFIGVFVLNCFLNFLLWIFTASAEIITYSGLLEWGVVLLVFTGFELLTAGLLFFENKAKWKRKAEEKKKESEKTDNEKLIDEISKSVKIKRPLVIDIALSSVLLYVFLLFTSAFL